MTLLLDKGADPNARLSRKTWFTQYNFDLLRVDDGGATPFWRAAYASDIAAMKLLLKYGADPAIATIKPFSRPRGTDADRDAPAVDVSGRPLPTGGPGIPPLLAAAGAGYGEGFAANAHRFAPTGMLAAVKFLVEELHVDVNARDHEGNTALHNAASRGDNEMIEYLVSKGADREGGQPRRPDHRRHGQRPGAADPALSGDDQAARRTGRQEQSQMRLVLKARGPKGSVDRMRKYVLGRRHRGHGGDAGDFPLGAAVQPALR